MAPDQQELGEKTVVLFRARMLDKLAKEAEGEEKAKLEQAWESLVAKYRKQWMVPKTLFVYDKERVANYDKMLYQDLLRWAVGLAGLRTSLLQQYLVDIIEIYGLEKALDPAFVVDICRKLEAVDFSQNLIKEANRKVLDLPPWAAVSWSVDEIPDECQSFREEFDLPSYAIDDPSTFEVDDAVSMDGDWYYVHVADVSRYLPYESEINKLASLRSTTVYFPDEVFPMLPPSLISCATLREAPEESQTLSVGFRLGDDGQVLERRLFPARTRKCYRITYEQVNKILIQGGDDVSRTAENREAYMAENDPDWLTDGHRATLRKMFAMAKILREKRIKQGALMVENSTYWEAKKDKTVAMKTRVFDSHSLIEEFMLLAGHNVAEECLEKGIKCAYRVTPPKATAEGPEQPVEVQLPAAEHIPDVPGESKACHHHSMRGMKAAFYAPVPIGHVALNANYCHFTSPLRRYPDLLVHYNVKEHLVRQHTSTPDTSEADTTLDGIVSADFVKQCHLTSGTTNQKRKWMQLAVETILVESLEKKVGEVVECYVADTLYVGNSVWHTSDALFCSTIIFESCGTVSEVYHSDPAVVRGTYVRCRLTGVHPQLVRVKADFVEKVDGAPPSSP